MDLKLYLSVTFLLSVWTTAKCDQIPDEVLHMECRDRYFLIAVDLSFTGNEPHFEAVDETGVYPITTQYAAECGYSVRVLPSPDRVALRASYFSCHTDNNDDVFTFNFNLVAMHQGLEITYALNKTCSPSLPWSPREVTCELNYMEVSVRSDVTCPTGTKRDYWDATVQTAYTSATSEWQVMFQGGEPLTINLTEAQKRGYAFALTYGRLVFRTPYGQPDSFSTEVNGVPVEVTHATLFSRQSWVILMVDLMAACPMSEGSYDNNGYMMWEIPEVLHPLVSGLREMQINLGANGELVEQPVAEERGYIVEKHDNMVQISIPYNAEGGTRKSSVSDGLFEYYMFDLYLDLYFVDEDHLETRLRCHRTLATPLLPRPLFAEDPPPDFDAVCSESGISFRLDYRPYDYLWEITIGSDPLTPELVAQHGYIMSNNSQSLLLEVPLFTQGYKYKDITLKGFFGTFEIRLRDHETSTVLSSTVKTCPFTTNEFIMCSTDGRMTVVANLSLAIPSGGVPARTNLIAKNCGPKETDDTRALFSFPLNSCGSTVQLGKEYVTYENKIVSKKLGALRNPADSGNEIDRVTMQCTYPLAGLHRLFSVHRFESDTDGVGRIVHSTHATGDLMDPTKEPITVIQTPVSTTKRFRKPVSRRPAYHPAAKEKVSSFLNYVSKKRN
uniref:Zona pellucida protein AX 4 n=1 Tax=Labrus bergylta TaxID=56723 RepID=A0A3Q3H0N6_9LABR